MKKEFLVERQGKTFALYAGILDMAHEMGLRSLETQIVQLPTKENGFVAVMRAYCTMNSEQDGMSRFEGTGDASPENVAPAMRSCLIRMAETRAKARCLRDAINVGVTALEELAEDETGAAPSSSKSTQAKPPLATSTKPPAANGGKTGTEIAWLNKLERLGIKHKPLPFMRFVLSEEHAERSDANFARAMKIPDPKLKEFATNLGEPQ